MLRPVCLLLLLVFSIYSSDLQFHNLLLNCDMPFYFPVVLLMSYMEMSGNVKITSSLSHLTWVPCSASSFQLCGIYCDWLVKFVVRLCNTQHCHSMRGRSPSRRSPRPGTLPQPADSAVPCTYSEGSFVFLTLRRGH